MIINEPRETFTIDGKTFTVGGDVFANSGSEYAGLFGTTTEILTESDGKTDNKKPEICCAFLPPESDRFIETLEERASAFYTFPRLLADMGMDDVSLSSKTLEPIAASVLSEGETVYALSCCMVGEGEMAESILGVSSDRSVLFRCMLEDLKSHHADLVLSHYEETMTEFGFVYEGRRVDCDDIYLCYMVSAAPFYTLVQGGADA